MQYNHIKIKDTLYNRPLAIRLYDKPLDSKKISTHAKTDKLRFFKTQLHPKREVK